MSAFLNWVRTPSATPRALFMKRIALIVPPFAMVGAGMELFMIKTGFCEETNGISATQGGLVVAAIA